MRTRSADCAHLTSLGDLNLTSWIADEQVKFAAPRMLNVLLSGFSGGVYRTKSGGRAESTVLSKIDISLDVEMAKSAIVASCRLSDMMIRLTYTDYLAVRRIIRDNVGKTLETFGWDNVEKAWAEEAEGAAIDQVGFYTFSNDVAYSSSARLVRYGQGKDSRSREAAMRLSLVFCSLSIILRRDDISGPSAFPYDMLVVRGQGFELDLGRKNSGDKWLNLSLSKIFAFDLGKVGRHTRQSPFEKPEIGGINTLSVLVEGYIPPDKRDKNDAEFDSQVVVKIDRYASPTGVTKVIIVVSYLSVTAFVGPLGDVVQFFTCEWPVSVPSDSNLRRSSLSGEMAAAVLKPHSPRPLTQDTLEIRFVSHYPRLIFAADESDPHSRALVLQG